MGDWRIAGFTEVRELGSGSQGRVVLARREDTGTPVAIKYLTRQAEDERARLRDEAVMLGRIRDPHVARLYSLVEGEHGTAIVMEAVEGVSLKRILAEHGALAPEAALTVLKGSLLGLAAAHAVGVIHRDYKPANIVVRADGLSKLIDFGVATPVGRRSRSGTPFYMAPEQWRGEPATPATDVYAAACVFFECITGRRPYPVSASSALMGQHLTAPVPLEGVPEPLHPLLTRGMAKNAAHRPAGARDLVAELEEVAAAAYGADWERRGVHALAGGAVALAAVFPLVASGLSAGTAAVGVTSVLGAKATAVAVGAAVAITAGGAYVAANRDEAPGSTGDAVTFKLTSATYKTRLTEATTQYVTVDGIRDSAKETRINTILRNSADGLVRRWSDESSKYGLHPSGQRWLAAATATLGARGPSLLSVYDELTSPQTTSGYISGLVVAVDLTEGRRLGPRDLLLPSAFTTAGLRALAREITRGDPDGKIPDGSICFGARPLAATDLTREWLGLLPTARGMTFVITEISGLDCDGTERGRQFTVPYARLRSFVRPDVIERATTTRP
ncbi:serine/threonine-protein kinase [Actinomadura macra]|uniref:serine/threonine-protein kinase n=1 Tax=Actinomadura macra TaxID=46164 RepID=UPI00083538D5|nr:serine/threonine-protein kinase [Actinomadura macra]